jgi:moderate conductance mechanosensitive channel
MTRHKIAPMRRQSVIALATAAFLTATIPGPASATYDASPALPAEQPGGALLKVSWTGIASAVAEPLAAADGTTAEAAPTNTSTPAAATDSVEIEKLIDTLKDPDRRAVLIGMLENLRKTMPKATQAVATPESTRPAAIKPVGALKPDSLGAQLVANGARFSEVVSATLLLAVRGVAVIPDLFTWLRDVTQDPASLLKGAASAGWLLCVVLIPLGGELLVRRMTDRFYRSLAVDVHRQEKESRDAESGSNAIPADPASTNAHAAHQMRLRNGLPLLRRLPFILMALTVDLLQPLAFLVVATLLLETQAASPIADRAVVFSIVRVYVTVRVLGAVVRATVGAAAPRLRLLPASDDAARYLMIWTWRIAVIIVAGYAVSQVGLVFGMDAETQQGVLRLTSLLVHVMLAVMVLQSRGKVAAHLRGSGHGFFGILRQRLAGAWHLYAIIFISAGWIIYAAEIRDGLERLIHLMLSTLAVGLVARVADIVLVGALDRTFAAAKNSASRFTGFEERLARYHNPLRVLLRLAVSASAIIALLQILGLDALGWFTRGALGGLLASSAAALILTLGFAVAVWEAINTAIQVYLDTLSRKGAVIRAARLRTIVPLLRNTLLITLVILTALTALSELGVNIGPLLAGASIFGVALGFGSQKLVQDFITGIFLLVENAMQVGDTVTAAGLSGTVENLSIRTIRLRAGDGSVHLIPFSSVSTVTNSNRGLGNAAVSVTVDYEEDSDRVGAVLTRVVAEMRADRAFAKGMLSDLQLWGVDRVDGTTMTLAGQVVCTDGARWDVQREFNRRVKIALQAEGICMMPIASVISLHHPLDIRLERRAIAKPVVDACPAASAESVQNLGSSGH